MSFIAFVPIGELVDSIRTWNPREMLEAGNFKYIGLSTVDKDKKAIDSELITVINPVEAPSRARQLIEVNDVLVATVRPNLNGVALVEDPCYSGATASTGYCVLRANGKLDPEYLYYWVRNRGQVNTAPSNTKIIVLSYHISPLGSGRDRCEVLNRQARHSVFSVFREK